MIAEFCNIIKIIPIADITIFNRNQYQLTENSDFDIIYCDSIPDSLIKTDNSSAGTKYSINESLIIDKVSTSIAHKYSYQRYTVMVLTTTLGQEIVLGCSQYPVLAHITPNIQTDSLSIVFNTTISPII